MKEQLIQWAKAGDGDCAHKLAKIYKVEGDRQSYVEWLAKSAETKNFDAMKEYAEILRKAADYEKAIAISVLNALLELVLTKFTLIEKHLSRTNFYLSLSIKLTIFTFSNAC